MVDELVISYSLSVIGGILGQDDKIEQDGRGMKLETGNSKLEEEGR